MRNANASPSYNARASRMRMRGLSKSANRTSRLIYGFCKPCTVIGLSREWREANRRTKCEIIQERQIEFRRAYISSRLDFKISSAAIIISTRRFARHAQTFPDYFDIFSYKRYISDHCKPFNQFGSIEWYNTYLEVYLYQYQLY